MGSNRQTEAPSGPAATAVEDFIARWQGREGGQERANYSMFLRELCSALDIRPPDPAGDPETNDYVFERVVKEPGRDGGVSNRRIDLYKRDCFVLEAKQSRQKEGGEKEVQGQADLFGAELQMRGRAAARAWDVLMFNARRQAEDYVRLLPAGHEPPPFVIVCDVGHCFEVYANFRRDGKAYDQFPDRKTFRIFLEDLRRKETRDLLGTIWSNPLALDPARRSAEVTRAIAARLAAVSKALEEHKHPPEDVAMFLMRCLFTMFAENVGLLPENSFKALLARCERSPQAFPHDVGQLWEAMDVGSWAHALGQKVLRFNGEFFRNRAALPLAREEIGELRQAASHDWRNVDPSIFGTLLEQALNPEERRKLGAHYTPRAYVERLVAATVIEPLRAEWGNVVSTVERQKSEGRAKDALATVRNFHDKLCTTRVLDPACGTGNFLYVSLELLKRLEGEVLEALADLGGQEALTGLEGHSVDPRQFLGMEVNPRAAAIAELVLWIGHLQWHIRTKGGLPSEPILRAFKNIVVRDAVLTADTRLLRDWSGKLVTKPGPDGKPAEVYVYDNPRRPEWPPAEFIVGNPPFIGGKDIRARQGDAYAESLWGAHPHMNESADYVMYWWDRAAELLTRKGTVLRRFGLVTTNSIRQIFQRRVIERHLAAKTPVSLVMAIPDHPWTKATRDAAAVRIAMTVCEAGTHDGVLREVIHENGVDTDTPVIDFVERSGRINSDLTVGVDVTATVSLVANSGIAHRGVTLGGQGFVLRRSEAIQLGLETVPGLDRHVRPFLNGRDLNQLSRGFFVIDLLGLEIDQVRSQFPEVYQRLVQTVKPERETNNRPSYRERWWIFAEPRKELRPALEGISRYIGTARTAKHRIFSFLDGGTIAESEIVVIASDDAYVLGILSARGNLIWSLARGGTLEDRPRYNNSICFDPLPFPVANDLQKQRIRNVAEYLDAHRKHVLVEHPYLTLTGLYNVVERLRAGIRPDALPEEEKRIFDDGLALILRELHDNLDAAVADAYGWPSDLSEEGILARLVALNVERAKEEVRGLVRWLRPEYQIPRFGTPKEKAELDLAGGGVGIEAPVAAGPRPAFPGDDFAQTAAVMSVLASASTPLNAASIAAIFKQGRKVAPKVGAVLAALARTGFVTSADGGMTFSLRRAA